MFASVTRESIGSHLHLQSNTWEVENPLPKSKLHLMSSTTIMYHFSSEWTISDSLFQGTLSMCIWFHLEMLMTKTNPSSTFPSLLHSSLSYPITPFHVVIQLPSSRAILFFATQSLGRLLSWKGFFASKGPKPKAYPFLKTIIPIIECSWKSLDTIGYQCPTMALLLKCFTNILLFVQFLSLSLLILVFNFKHPTEHFHAFLYWAHKFH